MFTATTCAAIVLMAPADSRKYRAAVRVGAIASTFAVAQVAFRRLYYADWVPNTAHVKIALTSERIHAGWEYVAGAWPFLRSLAVLSLMVAVIACAQPAERRRAVLPLAGALGWTACVVLMGGDYTPGRRHLVVVIVLASLGMAEGLRALLKRRWTLVAEGAAPSSVRIRLNGLAWGIATLFLVALLRDQGTDPERDHAIDDTWAWSGRDVGAFLERSFAAERPLVAVDAAGSLPYFAPRLPFLDMLGLNDRYIATHHPERFGTGMIGHELGDGAYLLRRQPDLIAFHTALGQEHAEWRGGREMQERPEFAEHYQPATFEVAEGTTTLLWVRRDGRVGVKRTDAGVVVPGYLLRSQGGIARRDAMGRLGLTVDESHPGRLEGIELEAGSWEARADASGMVELHVLVPPGVEGHGAVVRFELGQRSAIALSITSARDQQAHVIAVSLHRNNGRGPGAPQDAASGGVDRRPERCAAGRSGV